MAKVATGLLVLGLCACGGGRTPIEYSDPIGTTPRVIASGGGLPWTGGVTIDGGSRFTGGVFAAGGLPLTGGASPTGGARTGGGLPGTGGVPRTGGGPLTGGFGFTGGVRSGGLPLTGGIRTGGLPLTGGTRTGGLLLTGGIRTGGLLWTGGTRTGGISTGGLPLSGGAPGTGGIPLLGGLPLSGGAPGTGGIPLLGGLPLSGGAPGTGGISMGGLPLTGGMLPTGGAIFTGGVMAVCGNGVIEAPEICDTGPANYTRPAYVVTQGSTSFPVTPVVRVASPVDFYNYVSTSAHTGFEAANTSRIFLYAEKSSGALSLFFVHGIDGNTSGQNNGQGQVTLRISNLPETVSVPLSDDNNELTMSSTTSAVGNWSFNNNTDGGILSGLSTADGFEIMVSPAFLRGLTGWTWILGSGEAQSLALDQPITILANTYPGTCRKDCTVPRCGDGILDGGEWCDDGNTVGGDGCAADCKSFK